MKITEKDNSYLLEAENDLENLVIASLANTVIMPKGREGLYLFECCQEVDGKHLNYIEIPLVEVSKWLVHI